MMNHTQRRIPLALLAAVLSQTSAQVSAQDSAGDSPGLAESVPAESAPDGSAAAGSAPANDQVGGKLESCFNSRGMIDISVLSDQHMYVRTRGSNHYLITTEYCENLEQSYLHRTARLVPYGREVCLNDGSYVLYDDAGRESVCPIRRIELVEGRRQARDIVAGREPIVEFEELETQVEETPPE